MGEWWDDRLDLAFVLREPGAHEVPCNFLNPRPGAPLGDAPLLQPLEALKFVAAYRLLNPHSVLRCSGGRELGLQGRRAYGILVGANGLIAGNGERAASC